MDIYFNFINTSYLWWEKIVIGSLLTTIIWIVATFLTPAEDEETLHRFVQKVNPGGPGWKAYAKNIDALEKWSVPGGILSMLFGCFAIYGILLGTGQFIYGYTFSGIIFYFVGGLASMLLINRLK